MRIGVQARAKLREEDLLEIRRLKDGSAPIGRFPASFGISRPDIEAIVYRRS